MAGGPSRALSNLDLWGTRCRDGPDRLSHPQLERGQPDLGGPFSTSSRAGREIETRLNSFPELRARSAGVVIGG